MPQQTIRGTLNQFTIALVYSEPGNSVVGVEATYKPSSQRIPEIESLFEFNHYRSPANHNNGYPLFVQCIGETRVEIPYTEANNFTLRAYSSPNGVVHEFLQRAQNVQ